MPLFQLFSTLSSKIKHSTGPGWPCLLCAAWIILAASALSADEQRFLTYLEDTGETQRPISWCLYAQADGYRLVYHSEDETSIVETDRELNTRRWENAVPSRDTRLTAERRGDHIKLTGRFKGRPVDTTLSIDDKPWYQSSSLSLGGFAQSEKERERFWTIRPDTLRVYKVVAIKQKRVRLTLDSTTRQALKIKMRLTGALAPFWRCNYWFDPADGRFLQFKGPGGPPGTPLGHHPLYRPKNRLRRRIPAMTPGSQTISIKRIF